MKGWDRGETAAFNLARQWPVGGIDWKSRCLVRNCVSSMHVESHSKGSAEEYMFLSLLIIHAMYHSVIFSV